MKQNALLKNLSYFSFIMAIISLIFVDKYFKGFGLLFMFSFISAGLIFDQFNRLSSYLNSDNTVEAKSIYLKNRILKMVSLLFFSLSPIVLIYGKRFFNFQVIPFIIFLFMGLLFDQLARILYPYKKSI